MTQPLDAEFLERLLDATGAHLYASGASVTIVVVGGAALALRGWVARTTHDVDVIALAKVGSPELAEPHLPEALLAATRRVARDFGLPPDWLNPTVGAQFCAGLPPALVDEIEWRRFGGLTVGLAGRSALIALKLFATVDRGPDSVHLQDLLKLAPNDEELAHAKAWVLTQDIAPEWPELVAEAVDHVRRA